MIKLQRDVKLEPRWTRLVSYKHSVDCRIRQYILFNIVMESENPFLIRIPKKTTPKKQFEGIHIHGKWNSKIYYGISDPHSMLGGNFSMYIYRDEKDKEGKATIKLSFGNDEHYYKEKVLMLYYHVIDIDGNLKYTMRNADLLEVQQFTFSIPYKLEGKGSFVCVNPSDCGELYFS